MDWDRAQEIAHELAPRDGDQTIKAAVSEAISCVFEGLRKAMEEAETEKVETPPGIDISADPDGTRITMSFSHTINLGNYQNVKPFFSVSRNLREGESVGDVDVLKALYREGIQAYTWLVGIEMRHAEVLSEKGPWAFVKALLDYAQLPETTETGMVKADDAG